MKKTILLAIAATVPCLVTLAQTITPIANIQTPISSTNDTSVLHGQTVVVRGVVMTEPDSWYQSNGTSGSSSIWIQTPGVSGPKTGLQIRLNNIAAGIGTGFMNLVPGQEVEIPGRVSYFSGETQISLDTLGTINVVNLGQAIAGPDTVSVGTFNNSSNVAQPTGEQWQGSYVAIKDVNVVSVNTTNGRGNFTVQDASGNRIIIWDAHKFMRNQTNGYTRPTVGSTFCSIAGIIYHRAFAGSTPYYELHPFKASDIVLCSAPPQVTNMTRTPSCPAPSQSVTVTATVTTTSPGATIASVVLYYAFGATTSTYTQVNMTPGANNTYSASIPAGNNGDFVHYYIIATDNNGVSTRFPRFTPYSYTVNASGCTIRDIQFVAPQILQGTSQWYESGYQGLTVSGVKGVVTASPNNGTLGNPGDLGYLYIQQRGTNQFGGIWVIESVPTVPALQIGDSVTVSGTVEEYFGVTRLNAATVTKLGTTTPIEPILLPVNTFADSQSVTTEAFESMFVRFEEPNLQVVNVSTDPQSPSLKGDYRLGTNLLDPNVGTRVLAGRQTNNIFSSLNVPFVNDPQWEVTDGLMNVTPQVVTAGMQFSYAQGIMTYGFSRVKLLPRNQMDMALLTSQEKTFSTNSFSLYPNPTSGSVTVEYDRLAISGIVSIELLDLTGRVVHKTTGTNGKINFQTNDIANGLYLCKASQNGITLFTTRLMIAK
ncbi:MAG: T9SS type A sorting domain-containing protein [Bacteroidia bacterium]|nr:T9SS type A sorting domain-containing protein [Bacteroidia bacterium]